MRRIRNSAVAILLLFLGFGCDSGEEGAETPAETPTPQAVTEPIAARQEPPAEPEVALPEGFPERVPIYPELEITEVTIDDPESKSFVVKATARKSVDDVYNWYQAKFKELGWREDMAMVQPGMTIVGYVDDGLMVNIESLEGGLGCDVTITVAQL